jgi:hypothetical protein
MSNVNPIVFTIVATLHLRTIGNNMNGLNWCYIFVPLQCAIAAFLPPLRPFSRAAWNFPAWYDGKPAQPGAGAFIHPK